MCNLTKGRLEPCYDQQGGLKAVYFADYVSGLLDSATFDATDDEITAFASPITFYKYDLRGGVHNFDEPQEKSADNGTSFFPQSGAFVLKKQDKATRKELMLLGAGRPLVIVEDYNGNFRLAGIENGCDITVGSVSGSAMGDLSGYNLTLTANEKAMAYFVDPTIIGDTINTVVVAGT